MKTVMTLVTLIVSLSTMSASLADSLNIKNGTTLSPFTAATLLPHSETVAAVKQFVKDNGGLQSMMKKCGVKKDNLGRLEVTDKKRAQQCFNEFAKKHPAPAKKIQALF